MRKHFLFIACPVLCMGLGLAVIQGLAAGVEQDAATRLLGDWVVTSKYGTSDGEAVFREDMTYTLTEHHPDGTAVTHKGEYNLDLSAELWAVDLCVGKFSNPGSEWMTTFGILRFLSDDEAEIHFDPSGKRPESFNAVNDQNTHRMKRKE